MKTKFSSVFFTFLITFISVLDSSSVLAFNLKESADVGGIQVSPSMLLVKQNDIGKNFTVSVKNVTGTVVNVKFSECVAKKVGEEFQSLDAAVETSSLDIKDKQVQIAIDATKEVNVRVRLSAYTAVNEYPCMKIEQVLATNSTATPTIITVPFLLQHYKDKELISLTTNLSQSGLVTSNTIKLIGEVTNTGETYYGVTGKVSISKDGAKLYETDITSKLGGLLFPTDNSSFVVDWKNSLESKGFDSIGEYMIETKITSSESGKSSISKVYFTYIPADYIIIGGISVVTLALIIIGVIIFAKKNRKSE